MASSDVSARRGSGAMEWEAGPEVSRSGGLRRADGAGLLISGSRSPPGDFVETAAYVLDRG